MTANNNPVFALTPQFNPSKATTGDTSLTAPSNAVQISDIAPTAGSRIDFIDLQAVATTTATMLRLFLKTGSTYTLWREIPVQAIAASSSQPAWNAHLSSVMNPDILPLIMPSGYSMWMTVNDTQTGIFGNARSGDFQ
jgi:hypothetical protein